MIIMGLLAVAISVAALVITRGLLKQLGGEPDYTASIAAASPTATCRSDRHLRRDKDSLLAEMKEMRNSLATSWPGTYRYRNHRHRLA
jgi:methyl-accepting chemotaxis protein